MTQRPSCRSALIALPVAALIGCGGGDGPTGPVNALSPELAADAFDALSSISALVSAPGGPGSALRTGADVGFPMPSFTIDLDKSEPCPVSGTVRVVGSIEVNDVTGDIAADVRETHQSCVGASSSGRQWTFNGNPNVRSVLAFAAGSEESFSGSGSMTGGFRYSSQGDSGRCTISVTVSFSLVSASVAGTVCGQSVSQEIDFEP